MVKKMRNLIHNSKIVSEDERIHISLNSEHNKAIATIDGEPNKPYEIVLKNTMFNKIRRILFGSDTVQFEYYSIMKDYWKENPNMTKKETEELLIKIKKYIDMRVYNVLKEIDLSGDPSSKRRMDYVHAMMNVGERRKGESRREYKERCVFERNQALRRAKININYELSPNIKSLSISLNAMKAKKLAGSSIKIEKISDEKEEKVIQKTRRFKPVNFSFKDLKSKVANLQFRNKMRKMRFGAVFGVSAVLGTVGGYKIVESDIFNYIINNVGKESDTNVKTGNEDDYILNESEEKTTKFDVDGLLDRDTKGKDMEMAIDVDKILNQDSQSVKEKKTEKQVIEHAKQNRNEGKKVKLKDILMEILNIGFDSEIHNLQGKCSDSPEKKGKVKYKSGAKKVGIVDVITNDGYIIIRSEDGHITITKNGHTTIKPKDSNITFAKIKKAYPDAKISYHVISAKGNGISGWNLSTENNIEEKMVKTALHKIKPYILNDTEIMQFLCENDINSNIDANKYKGKLKKIRQAVKQYEIDNQSTSNNGQTQDGVR